MYLRKLLICLTALTMVLSDVNVKDIVGDIREIMNLGKGVTSIVSETWKNVENSNILQLVNSVALKLRQRTILDRMNDLSRQITAVEDKSVKLAHWTVESITEQVQMDTKLLLGFRDLNEIFNSISMRYTSMNDFGIHDDFEPRTLKSFAEWTVAPNDFAIQELLDRLHLLIFGSSDLASIGNSGVLYQIADSLQKSSSQVCTTRQSAQQVLYQLYSVISITELKGYALMQFSWIILNSFGKGNFSRESKLMQERFTERTHKTQTLLKKVMERADRHVWRCDPDLHVEHETYETLTRLLQGYIENEADMGVSDRCTTECKDYQFNRHQKCTQEHSLCATQPKCEGTIRNCQLLGRDMWVCQKEESSMRRYEYIVYPEGTIGKKGHCSRNLTLAEHWMRFFYFCDYCLCICDDDESPKSDRYFNLRETVSSITANRVITGLRFRKFNRIIHLQLQEGEMGPRGTIDSSTLQWKPMSDYNLLEEGIQNGIDYHKFTWDERSIDLDELLAPNSHVVTGVRFRKVGTHLNLEIRITEADFASGLLMDADTASEWISNDNTVKRTEVVLIRPDVPTNSRVKYTRHSTTNQYVQFTHTDMVADVAQTTVPYLDAQDVVSIPPCPIFGVGIYYKGLDTFGGFVAPKLITFDYSPHIEIVEEASPVASTEKMQSSAGKFGSTRLALVILLQILAKHFL